MKKWAEERVDATIVGESNADSRDYEDEFGYTHSVKKEENEKEVSEHQDTSCWNNKTYVPARGTKWDWALIEL